MLFENLPLAPSGKKNTNSISYIMGFNSLKENFGDNNGVKNDISPSLMMAQHGKYRLQKKN